MAVIFANCPSCLHQFSLELGEVKPGRHRFTVLCSNCEYIIRFDYRLIMAPGSKTDLKPKEIEEVLTLIDDGKNDSEIKEMLGLSGYRLRQIRDENNRPRSKQWDNRFRDEQKTTVIDMIREGNTLAEISRQVPGVSKRKIKEWREEQIEEGNPLPELIRGVSRRQKYSDEELIELAFMNPGYGFKRFVEYLGVRENFLLDLFIEYKKFTNGEEDPLAALQDPSFLTLVTESEYKKITGKSRVPRGLGRAGGGRPSKASEKFGTGRRKIGDNRGIPLPPQEFKWGPYQRKWGTKRIHDLEGPMTIDSWIEEKMIQKGYVRFSEDAEDFSKRCGAGSSAGIFRKWMKRAGLTLDNRYGYWIVEERSESNPIIDWIIQRVNLNGYISRQTDLYDFAEQTGAGKTKFNKWMNKAGLTFDKNLGRWYLKD